MKEIKYYQHTNGDVPVIKWLESLDISVRKRINGRLVRIVEDDNFGDFKKIDDTLSELRFHFGSGYRIYYAEYDDVVVLLLNAGDKKLQMSERHSRCVSKANVGSGGIDSTLPNKTVR